MKKKIMIYIEDDLFVRNYFTYNSFDLPEYDVVFYASEQVTQRYTLQNLQNFRGYLHEDKKRTKIRNLQFSIQLFKFIKLSKSFKFRFFRFKPSIVSRHILKIVCLPIISHVFSFFLQIRLGENKEVKKILIKEKPDLIIAPSQVAGSISSDIIEISNKLGIKTLFLIDGWDNISSKTIFPTLPTYIAVWGQQSLSHAVKIQKFSKENIFIIGTPRFEFYASLNTETKKLYDFQYIIFTGCAIPFDEITTLKVLDHCLINNNIKDIKIIYRPHPWRQDRNCFDYFIEQDFKNIVMDKQMKEYYYCTKIIGNTNALQPSLEYYPNLLKNCLFSISPLTTMIIEAALMNKYVLTLAYDDGYHYTNPLNALRNYEHFSGIEKISAFKFCYNLRELPNIFLSLLKIIQNDDKERNFKNEIKHIIKIVDEPYSQRLNKIVNRILNDNFK